MGWTGTHEPADGSRGELWLDLGAGAALLALTLLFYWELAFAGRILTGYDLFTYTYPYKDFAAASLRAGHIPLWNPYLFFGAPFLANIQTAVLYPVNVLTSYMGAPQAASLSIVLHVFLAGAGMYAFARLSVDLGRAGSFLAALVFMFSGFVTAQVGHLNQITVSVWLPLLLLCFEQAYRRRSLRLALAMALIVALQALAGGPQQLYLSLMVLGLFMLFLIARRVLQRPLALTQTLPGTVGALLLFGFGAGLGLGLGAVQLLPSLELSKWSIRGGGLGYPDATSFSLPPPDLLRALLPGFTSTPFSEFVAYIGAAALSLVLVAVVAQWRHPYTWFCVALVVVGLVLALGKFTPLYEPAYRHVPGFDSFRVPARWLYLYSFGISILAGMGMSVLEERSWTSDIRRWKPAVRTALPVLALVLAAFVAVWMTRQRLTMPSSGIAAAWVAGAGAGFLVLLSAVAWPKVRRWASVLLILMVAVELFFGRRQLDAFKSVPAEAYTSPRPALTYLLGDKGDFRVLSIVDSAYDAGDKRKLLEVYRGRLRPERINEMLVGMKYREMLSPNLSVAYRIPTIDGYDGGILPLRAYVEFKRLILDSSSGRMAPPGPPIPNQADGVLRNQLRAIPDVDLLGALSVKYVLMDKRRDVWIDNVYYDLGTTAVASAGSSVRLEELPQVSTTAIGLVSFLQEGAQVPEGTPVARVTVAGKDGRSESMLLRAGVDTAEGDYQAGKVRHGSPRAATAWSEGASGVNYYGRLDLKGRIEPVHIEVEYLLPSGRLYLRAMSLIDGPALAAGSPTAFDSVMLDQRLRLVQSGDLKVYENLDYISRAFTVHEASLAPTMEETFAGMRGNLQRLAVLEDTPAAREAVQALGGDRNGDDVEVTSNEPEHVLVTARMAAPGILVLTDTNFPGWSVRVDGKPAAMLRADHLFRAVFVPGGEHTIEFVYSPQSFKRGVILSCLSLGLVVLLLVVSFTRAWKSRVTRGKDV